VVQKCGVRSMGQVAVRYPCAKNWCFYVVVGMLFEHISHTSQNLPCDLASIFDHTGCAGFFHKIPELAFPSCPSMSAENYCAWSIFGAVKSSQAK